MANHKSAVKRAGQNVRRRMRNKAVRTVVKNQVKGVRLAAAEGSTEDAAAILKSATSKIDKAAKKGVIHKRTAARKISRLAKMVNGASA